MLCFPLRNAYFILSYREQLYTVIFRLVLVADVPHSQTTPLASDRNQNLRLRRVNSKGKDAIRNHFSHPILLKMRNW